MMWMTTIMRVGIDRGWDKVKYSNTLIVEPSVVQALKNPNPLKDVEDLVVLAVAELS